MGYSVLRMRTLALFMFFFTMAQAGFPWLISEDEKTSWFSGPTTKCYFGKQWYKIGQNFRPLLPPFGRMPCMNCTCLKHPQFPLFRPTVTCRNVRNECPLVSCADPITRKGECCPSCHKEYIALVLPSSKESKKSGIGRVHLTLVRKFMFVCLKIESATKIINIKLKDKNTGRVYHHVLEGEFKVSNANGKTCIKRDLPKLSFGGLVRSRVLLIEIITSDSTIFHGLFSSYHMFSEVPFLALLNPHELFLRKPYVAAGMASMSGDRSKDKIAMQLSLLFQPGYLKLNGHEKVGSAVVRILKRPWKPDKLSPVLKTYSFIVRKKEIMSGELLIKTFEWRKPRAAHFRWMVRGTIFVTIDFKWEKQESSLFGRVLIHDSCRKFYSVLNGGGLDPPKKTITSGVATLSLGAKSKLHYKVIGHGIAKAQKMDVHVVDVYDQVLKTLVTIKRNPEEDIFKASGIWEKPSAEAVNLLFKGGIFIKVTSNINANDDMRGRIKQTLYLNEADFEQASIISIHDVDTKATSKTSAAAVVSADSDCNIHYLMDLSGYSETSTAYKLTYAKLRLDGMFNKARRTATEIRMGPFNENFIAYGSIMNPSEEMLVGVATGMAQIELQTSKFVSKGLQGQVTFASNDCNKIQKKKGSSYLHRSIVGSDPNFAVCLYQGRFYDHGAEWHPLEKDGKTKKYCIICKCHKRRVTCKQLSCPKPNCLYPVRASEYCCPVCTSPPNGRAVDPRKACVVGMATRNDIRAIGEAWHPVLPVFGIVKCVVCICISAPGNKLCSPVLCPKLNCKTPEKPRDSCCPVCPNMAMQNHDIDQKGIQIESSVAKKKAACLYGRRSYPHGTSWKPILPQFGVLRCVICRCKNGRLRCRKLRCLKSARCRLRNGKTPTDPCCMHCPLKRKPELRYH